MIREFTDTACNNANFKEETADKGFKKKPLSGVLLIKNRLP